ASGEHAGRVVETRVDLHAVWLDRVVRVDGSEAGGRRAAADAELRELEPAAVHAPATESARVREGRHTERVEPDGLKETHVRFVGSLQGAPGLIRCGGLDRREQAP